VSVKLHATVAPGDAYVELAEEGDVRQRRPLTHQVSRWLFVVVGVGLMATVVCIVMFRTGSRDDVPWYYLAIVFGLPSALCAFLACFVRALDDVR
jgi:peptidoglycan/LPS O-acetylase OafA/YrhL